MTAALIIAATLALLWAMKRHCDHILDEILNAELREIDRAREAGQSAGIAAMDALGRSANR